MSICLGGSHLGSGGSHFGSGGQSSSSSSSGGESFIHLIWNNMSFDYFGHYFII